MLYLDTNTEDQFSHDTANFTMKLTSFPTEFNKYVHYRIYCIHCFLSAVYNAVGLAAFDLFDDINFDVWFPSHLIQELQIKHAK